MKEIIIVYGPPKSGKTLNREAIAKHFSCDAIFDGGDAEGIMNHEGRCLVLASEPSVEGLKIHGAEIVSIFSVKKALGEEWKNEVVVEEPKPHFDSGCFATRIFQGRVARIFEDFQEETTITTKTFVGDGGRRLWGIVVTQDDDIPAIVWTDRDDPKSRVYECWLDEAATTHLREILALPSNEKRK
jgi:hypothetical protein